MFPLIFLFLTSSNLLTWDFHHLRSIREAIPHEPLSPSTSSALHNLYISTSAPREIPSITDKYSLPPGATPNHYVSIVPYAFPCDNHPNPCFDYNRNPPNASNCTAGLPWVICDDQLNQNAAKTTDRPKLERIARDVTRFALGAYLFRCPKRAALAAAALKVWFVSEETRMLPTLRFAQGIPGVTNGKHAGVIDLSVFVRSLADAILLLQLTPEAEEVWGKTDREILKKWAKDMATHLMSDTEISKEGNSRNNHGVYYDGTLLSLLKLGTDGEDEMTGQMLDSKCQGWHHCVGGRLIDQIDEEGALQWEIKRRGRSHYVWYTLVANAHLVAAAKGLGGSEGCVELVKAADWAVERLDELMEGGEGSWLIYGAQALRLVSRTCGEQRFEDSVCKIMDVIREKKSITYVWNEQRVGMDIWNLVFPGRECGFWKSVQRFEVPIELVGKGGADKLQSNAILFGMKWLGVAVGLVFVIGLLRMVGSKRSGRVRKFFRLPSRRGRYTKVVS